MKENCLRNFLCLGCGKKLKVQENEKGEIKTLCDRCGAVIFSRRVTPKKRVIEITEN